VIDIHKLLQSRALLKKSTRNFFENRSYLEVDTPIVTRCPGAEVFLHYFETSWTDHSGVSHSRYLRSSPELHMKRLVAEGLPRVFQVGACFRDRGEYSEWHNPEFSMLEWYQVGLSYKAMIQETEEYLRETADSMATVTSLKPSQVLPDKFEWLGVYDAFKKHAGIVLEDQDPELAKKAIAAKVISVQPSDDFETAFFKTLIEKLEPVLARLKGCVLMDYPASQASLAVVENGRASRFEYYLGRVEMCNGFYELTGEQNNRDRIGEALRERVKQGNAPVPEDEDFYRAMAKFTAPCAGNALGFDRWLALLQGQANLDYAISFRGMK
jgi:elongation factor P--(R)-beta-lysine ligase